MYHLYINTPDGMVGDCKPSQLVRAAIMAPTEYARIRSHLSWKQVQAWDARQRQQRITNFKECSQNIVKTWRNTLVNKQVERQEKRRRRLQSMEDHKNALYEKSCAEKENERRKKLEQVRTYFLYERDDIRNINSAYVLTEILRERQEQLKFKEKMRAKEQEKKEEHNNRIKKDVECFQEKQRKASKEEGKAKLKRRKELIEQLREHNEKYEEMFQKEKQMEKEDLELMKEEMKLMEENTRKEAERKKAVLKEDVLESRRNANEKAKLQKVIDEDQDKAVEIYLGYKHKIDCLLKKETDRGRKELEGRQEAIRKKVWESFGSADRALTHKDEDASSSAAEEQKQRTDKAERLRRERREAHDAFLREGQREAARRAAAQRWETALRFKRAEVDKIRELRRKQHEWEAKCETRKGYNAQIEEKYEKINGEKEEALRELCRIVHDDSIVHEAFFKHAKEYLDKVRQNKGNDFPIIKEIENYRQRHGFRFVEKHEQRRRDDEKRWQATSKPRGDASTDTDTGPGLEKALTVWPTVWPPQRACPLVCPEGRLPDGNSCRSPRGSLNLPRIRSSDICGQIKRDILLREMAQKAI